MPEGELCVTWWALYRFALHICRVLSAELKLCVEMLIWDLENHRLLI